MLAMSMLRSFPVLWRQVGLCPVTVAGIFDMISAMRCIEAKLREMGSVQMLYADIFQTRAEFQEMFNHDQYRKVRSKYKADGAFPEPYDKMNVIGLKKDRKY